MKTFAFAASAACLLSQVAAQQFVMYTGTTESDGDDNSVQRADPILAPGKISQHVHQIFGSNGFDPEVTYESLQKATCTTVGDASGKGNKQDKSIYWHPALYMEAKDGSGYIRVPTLGHKFYYKNAGTGTPRVPFEFPHGFRMLAGNPFMRAAAPNLQRQNITQWICHDSSGDNQGTAGGFPNGVTDCDAYPGFNGAIHFPHCWNGDAFNPADPSAHVVYPTGDIENGECPPSHPTRLPHIFAENQFNLHSVVDKVEPNTFTLAMGDNTGYGWHADFFNGWDDGALPKLFDTCPQGEYGNEDIGSCPSFEAGTPTNECKLSVSFVENVDKPGKNLPGCNPVSDQNPAPFYQTAPLGTYSDHCKLESNAPPNAAPAPAGSSVAVPAESSPAPATSPTTTLIKSAKTSTTRPTTSPTSPSSPAPTSGSTISCPESDLKTVHIKGKFFKVQCGVDHAGGDLSMVYVQSLEQCIETCATTQGCVDVSLSGTACYMKSSLGARQSNSGVDGAKLVTGASIADTKAVVHRHAARHIHRL